MSIKLMTFPEARKDIETAEHKRVCLIDKNSNKLVSWNSQNTPIDKRLKEIQKRLESSATMAGIYQIHAKHYGRDASPAIYYIQVGDPEQALGDIKIDEPEKVVVQAQTGATVSYDKYNEIYLENLRLNVAVDRLTDDVEALTGIIDDKDVIIRDLEEAEPEESGFLSDNNKEFLKSTMEQILPVADMYFDQQNKKLALEMMRMQNPTFVQQPNGIPVQMPNGQPPVQGQPVQGQPVTGEQMQHMAAQPSEDGEITETEEAQLNALGNMQSLAPEVYAEMMSKLESYYKQNPEAQQ